MYKVGDKVRYTGDGEYNGKAASILEILSKGAGEFVCLVGTAVKIRFHESGNKVTVPMSYLIPLVGDSERRRSPTCGGGGSSSDDMETRQGVQRAWLGLNQDLMSVS